MNILVVYAKYRPKGSWVFWGVFANQEAVDKERFNLFTKWERTPVYPNDFSFMQEAESIHEAFGMTPDGAARKYVMLEMKVKE